MGAMDSRPPHGGRGLKLKMLVGLMMKLCRPPHGGRGLKSNMNYAEWEQWKVVLHTGDVD